MSTFRQLQIVFVLLAIFVVGGVSGALLTVRVVKKSAAKALQPQNLAASAARHYQQELELTPKQVEELRPVFQQTAKELAQSRRDMYQALQRMQEQMDRTLTAPQREKFAEVRERSKARIKAQLDNGSFPRIPKAESK